MSAINILTSDVLVLGNSRCAHRIAANLHSHQISVVQVTVDAYTHEHAENTVPAPSRPLIQTLSHTRVQKAFGAPGDFQVRLESNTGACLLKTGQIVIAEEAVRKPCFAEYGLQPSANVTTLSEFRAAASAVKQGSIVFLAGLVQESNPVITRETMLAAQEVSAAHAGAVYILTRNLKVADHGLEALYRDTKAAGVTYIKFTDTACAFDQLDNGTVTLAFEDEYTRERFQLAPDLLVVDETIQPSKHLNAIASAFELHADPEGFIQKENVHRVGVFTNRRGIYAAGPARGVPSSAVQQTDADDVSLVIVQQHRGSEKANAQAAEIDPRQCVRCLTCLRLCPYGAITLNTKPSVMPTACEGCGLCRAECPRQAIFLEPLEQANLIEQAGLGLEQKTMAPGKPRMVAFCCSRSAAQAGHMATCMGQALPPNLIFVEVPCAGGISIRHILGAFETGADGVLVLTCHLDNCHSEYGNQYAHARVHQLQGTLQSIGLNAKRLLVRTLASNMGFEFAEIVNQFERELKG